MIRLFKHYIPFEVMLLCLVDLLLLALAAEIGWQFRIFQLGIDPGAFLSRLPGIAGFAVIVWLAIIAVGTYTPLALRSLRYALARMFVALGLGIFAISFVNLVFPGTALWRSILLYAMGIGLVLLVANRLVFSRIIGTQAFRRRILVLGAGPRAQRLVDMSNHPDSGFKVVACVAMGSGSDERVDNAIERASITDFGRFVAGHGAHELVLAMQERRNTLPLKDLLRVKTTGVDVSDLSGFLERETGRLDLDTLNPSWLIFSDGFTAGQRLSSIAKRIFDIVASLLLLVIALPLIIIFAVLVKLESRGPAFYRQVRVGLFGEPFQIPKLRSMRQDAEADGAKWAEKDDPRITRVGRFIRTVRIDELPQLWSVLKGEMSFVGPRPERPQFVAELEEKLPYYAERHMVKPGITGWAQINYPYGASIEDARSKLEYDLYYAKNYSPFLDLLILLQTGRVILWPEGAR
ncbi:TIGR03013 family XrtA/PEP-CTERM system glycosyltransferase [Qipengyuania psychrotolerans]|uniref:TIGR03013 family PEP-CTERM/XrtA system glycosyltransferase n=1 Tax=Qipengyuania psychrotolerans TaxID=2867238 RepID=A0ABX8ZJV5_9SPHN|nr:TIGR03013 family XrtA/PEP-CTERM system glycosyltransferase [Qipengyuania psychrotolerans]QZD87974.1 TIGR03013 family PEP-CTERM/XrtA system glycosyltransferase [Qipengyuania psychrotolerans]